MAATSGITVVIPTFNRADRLAVLLESLQHLEPPSLPYDIIVADNGSTDGTAATVRRFAERSRVPVRYLHEPRRGASHARNAAIDAASGSIVAFTDDDQDVAPDWLIAIERAFWENPDVHVIGGRVLPRWLYPPPDWITPETWGPVSIVDRGNDSFRLSRNRWMCLPGGNMAWRRPALTALSGFSPEYPRSQDRELLVRYLLSGGIAMYVPGMIVHHYLDRRRLTKTYFRSWNLSEGRMRAGDGFYELFTADGGLRVPPPATRRILGVPRYLYRQWARALWLCIAARIQLRHVDAFRYELKLLQLSAYLRWRIELTATPDASFAHRAGATAARAAASTAAYLGFLTSWRRRRVRAAPDTREAVAPPRRVARREEEEIVATPRGERRIRTAR